MTTIKNIFFGLLGGVFGFYLTFSLTNTILSELFMYDGVASSINYLIKKVSFIEWALYFIFVSGGLWAGISYKKIFYNRLISASCFSSITFLLILSLLSFLDFFIYYKYVEEYLIGVLISGILSAGIFFGYKYLVPDGRWNVLILSLYSILAMLLGLFIMLLSIPTGS